MEKKLEQVVFDMTNPSFEESIKILFELDEKIPYKNNFPYKNTKKKRIAIIYDVEGWAYCNTAKEIKKNLKEHFDITIIPDSVVKGNIIHLLLLANQFDLVHCLWRGYLSSLDNEFSRSYIYNMGYEFDEFIERYLKKANITTSVCDHIFLDKESFEWTKSFAKYTKNYTVLSIILKEIYDKLDIDKKPAAVITDGVDLEKFKPRNLERLTLKNLENRRLRIGWVGNSEFVDSEGDTDLKGVRNIIKPVLQELINEGYPIEIKFADKKDGYIPHDKMPDYYNSIDIYICASKNEGSPDPILESMACGVPIISTDVGIVSEALGEKQKQFILKERSREALKETLKGLLENKEQLEELSKENLEKIQGWTWKIKCEQYKEFFNQNLK